MHTFMTGAAGLVGRARVLSLLRDGQILSVWTLDPQRASTSRRASI